MFLLAFFLDFFELAFIIVPLLIAPDEALGIDLIWFGIILGVNMQTSFMHPPFGFALFYLRSVAPKMTCTDKVTGVRTPGVSTGQVYWGGAVRGHSGGDGGRGDRLPATGHALQGQGGGRGQCAITLPTLPTLNGGGIGGAPVLGAPKLGAPVVNP